MVNRSVKTKTNRVYALTYGDETEWFWSLRSGIGKYGVIRREHPHLVVRLVEVSLTTAEGVILDHKAITELVEVQHGDASTWMDALMQHVPKGHVGFVGPLTPRCSHEGCEYPRLDPGETCPVHNFFIQKGIE